MEYAQEAAQAAVEKAMSDWRGALPVMEQLGESGLHRVVRCQCVVFLWSLKPDYN